MRELSIISGRDVSVSIDGKNIMQSESIEIKKISDIHKIRSCFHNNDIAHIRTKSQYKIILVGIRLKKPFENFNFYDLDDFSVEVFYDNTKITFQNCMWSDYMLGTDKEKLRERVCITALDMNMEGLD